MDEISKYICTGFGVTMIKSLADDMVLSTETFMERIKQILVKRTGPAFNDISTNRNATLIAGQRLASLREDPGPQTVEITLQSDKHD